MQNKFCLSLFVLLVVLFQGIWSVSNPGDICSQKLTTGRCFASFERFGFNSTSGECQKFIYGGCDGNDNNFVTKEACQTVCEGICSLKTETGLCKAHIPVFGFNSNTGKCENFIYGGCVGNKNRFSTEEDCQVVCENQKS